MLPRLQLQPNDLTEIAVSRDLPAGQRSLSVSFFFTTSNDLPSSFILRVSCYNTNGKTCRLNFAANERMKPLLFFRRPATVPTDPILVEEQVALDSTASKQEYRNGAIMLHFTVA